LVAAEGCATSAIESDPFRRGWERLREVDAEGGERVIESLQSVAPDFGHYVVEFAFGDIYSRPVLDPRQRQLVTISAPTTRGGAEPLSRFTSTWGSTLV
jgi:4-carboxymuconolactone decarboxylase